MVDQQLNYIPKFPKYITRIDSIILEKSAPKKNIVFMGADLGVSTNYVVFKPKIELLTKQGLKFDLGYDIINKGYYVGISKQIKFKK